jgi:tetratricopeptide (TPR) repeat protein
MRRLLILICLGGLAFGGWKAWEYNEHGPSSWSQGKRALVSGEYESAIRHFDAALYEEPDREHAIYLKLGICYDKLGDRTSAVRYYRDAQPFIDANPSNVEGRDASRRLEFLRQKGH